MKNILSRHLLLTFLLFSSIIKIYAQQEEPLKSIIIPVGQLDIWDYDNQDFRWTIGLGAEIKIAKNVFLQTIFKKERGRYRTGIEDWFITGSLNSYSLKSGISYRLIQLKNLNLKLGINYLYAFSESNDAVINSPGVDDWPIFERQVFNGAEFDIDLEIRLYADIWLFTHSGLQIGQLEHYWNGKNQVTMENETIDFGKALEIGFPIVETIGIKYKF